MSTLCRLRMGTEHVIMRLRAETGNYFANGQRLPISCLDGGAGRGSVQEYTDVGD